MIASKRVALAAFVLGVAFAVLSYLLPGGGP